MSDHRKIVILICLTILLVMAYIFYQMPLHHAPYFLSRRLPRVFAMILASAAISISTGLFQTISSNRILTPDLLGYSSMYALMQTLMIFLVGGMGWIIQSPLVSFLLVSSVMVLSSMVLYTLVLRKTAGNMYLLLLLGMVISTFFRSFSSFFQLIMDPNEFSILQNRLLTSVNSANTQVIFISGVVIIVVLPWIIRNLHKYDVLLLGNTHAINLGVDVAKLNQMTLFMIAVLVSVATSMLGPIMFLGLLSVNLARQIMTDYRHKSLLLTSFVLALLFLVFGQLMLERIFAFSINLAVVINVIGGSYLIYLIVKEKAL